MEVASLLQCEVLGCSQQGRAGHGKVATAQGPPASRSLQKSLCILNFSQCHVAFVPLLGNSVSSMKVTRSPLVMDLINEVCLMFS